MARTIVLGAGFGGITVATELRRLVGADHEIVLVDRSELFMMGLRKLWAIVGLGTLEDGRRPRADLERHGIRFLQREILAIDAAARRVTLDGETLDGEHLVIALGAEPRPDLVPGLAEHAHNLYDAAAVPALARAIADFDGGSITIVIAGVPYRCPPAPYEFALLLDAHLRERGVRGRAALAVSTLQPMLLPNAGRAGSDWLAAQLGERDIAFHTGRKVQRVEAGRVVFDGGEEAGDVLVGVPPHRAPRVVKVSGLTGDGEWIAVDPATFATGTAGVFAIGDVTQIMLANGLPLPKAGLFAELEGVRVARAIAAELGGTAAPPPFDGHGYCFLEVGPDSAALVQGEFFARPEPHVALVEPSAEHAREKRAFETERLQRWFGS